MKNYSIILLITILLCTCTTQMQAQSTDSLIYTLVNHTADLFYQKKKDVFSRNDTLKMMYLFIDSKIASYEELRPDGAYTIYLDFFILKNQEREQEINQFRVYRGIGEGIDSLRWGSLNTQTKQIPPIKKWDCNKIDKKFKCTDKYKEERNKKNTHYIIPPAVDSGKYLDYADSKALKYGLQIGYPALFEYRGVIYGFSTAYFKDFRSGYSSSDGYYYLLSEWNGETWKIITQSKQHFI